MELQVYGYKCRKCGQLHYPFRMVCKKCKANEPHGFDPVPLPKKGKLLTYTDLSTLPADFNVAQLTLGIVELENGIRVTGQVRIPKPKTGMAVRINIETVRSSEFGKNLGMVFTAA
ncbi:MAG TPA: hypothetical protein P5567_13355 [Kiritimatiellia bacterium]|nr:hypothetical protein [Kiritimatiellia bacterium]HRZ13430.1 hypothetical protein [Kiritimatiellia bacterium]HSA18930.1 hypothetical protein [Kiritimatiellia bacterium]